MADSYERYQKGRIGRLIRMQAAACEAARGWAMSLDARGLVQEAAEKRQEAANYSKTAETFARLLAG